MHIAPQPAQLLASARVSTHTPLHVMKPGPAQLQFPPMQVSSAPHAMLQPPQLLVSKFVFVHSPSHSVSPIPQEQAPFMHKEPPVQTFPQAPQFCESVLVFTQPAGQDFSFAGQAATHFPFAQTSPFWQAFPHMPQFWVLDERVTHWPPQLVVPALH
jgi:hypothetical protein